MDLYRIYHNILEAACWGTVRSSKYVDDANIYHANPGMDRVNLTSRYLGQEGQRGDCMQRV